MKLQHLAVIFILIIMPIALVLSTYVGNLVDVSNKEAKYDSVLLNATYDAVRAHQMATLNNTYASINSSRMRDLNATINTFFNSVATGLSSTGYKKSELNEYVPAILITLYDGYYVYGPFENYAKVDSNGLKYITDTASGTPNSEYGLKPYMNYTCQYKKENSYNVVINYTLDNYISVAGTYQDGSDQKYITGSGYYVNPNGIYINDNTKEVTLSRSGETQVVLRPEELSEWLSAYNTMPNPDPNNPIKYTTTNPSIAKYRYVNLDGEKYYYDTSMGIDQISQDQSYQGFPIFKLDGNLKIYISVDRAQDLAEYLLLNSVDDLMDLNNFKDINHYWYYLKAKTFSETVYNSVLNKIDISDENVIVTESYNRVYNINTSTFEDDNSEMTSHIKSDYSTKKIFNYNDADNNPELDSSSFNQHRMDVIISSIEDSLSTSIANFNRYQSLSYDYRMPTITETDWEKMANNVNVVAFLQGLVVGNFKYYNNYSLVSNTKNKEFISKEAIRVQVANNDTNISAVETNYKQNTSNYHLPTCKKFHNEIQESSKTTVGYRMIDYEIQSYEYGIEGTQNYYMQAGTGDYECVISNNKPTWTYDEIMRGVKIDSSDTGVLNNEIRRAYITALAREKENCYQNLENLNQEVVLNE